MLSCFPGLGKTYTAKYDLLAQYGMSCKDMDSSSYHWTIDDNGNKIENPLFPINYISDIINNVNKNIYDFIFVSSHETVRLNLIRSGVDFISVYPHILDKDQYINTHLKNRETGLNDSSFISNIERLWNYYIPDPMDPDLKKNEKYNWNIIWLYRLNLVDLCIIMPYILAVREKSKEPIKLIKYGNIIDDAMKDIIQYNGLINKYGEIIERKYCIN